MGCEPKGMPIIMGQPFPIEFIDQEGSIVLRIEEYDAVRSIRMGAAAAGATQPAAPYGHSTGKWEGRTLVVETTRVQPRRYTNGALKGRGHVTWSDLLPAPTASGFTTRSASPTPMCSLGLSKCNALGSGGPMRRLCLSTVRPERLIAAQTPVQSHRRYRPHVPLWEATDGHEEGFPCSFFQYRPVGSLKAVDRVARH